MSFRRHYLDLNLKKIRFSGEVIDIGGKKENTRGEFKPPLETVNSWKYCNIDPKVSPDFLCSANEIPVDDSNFDFGIICEVIEHLESPQEVLKEAFRIIKPKGKLIGSIPFMFPKHADPYDFQRWTDNKLTSELERVGFRDVEISHMGGTLAVVWDMVRVKFEGNSVLNRFSRLILKFLSLFILSYYKGKKEQSFDNTSGFFFIATKPD